MSRASDGTIVLGTATEALLIRDYKKVGSLPIDYDLLSVACHPTLSEVAIGGKVWILTLVCFNFLSLSLSRITKSIYTVLKVMSST